MKQFARHARLMMGLILMLAATGCFRSAGGEVLPTLDASGGPAVAFNPTPTDLPAVTQEVTQAAEQTPQVFDFPTATPPQALAESVTQEATEEASNAGIVPTETLVDLLTLITPTEFPTETETVPTETPTETLTETVDPFLVPSATALGFDVAPTETATPTATEVFLTISATSEETALAFVPTFTETATTTPTETATASQTATETPTVTPDPFLLPTETPLGFQIAPTETPTASPTVEVDLLILPSPTEAVSGLIIAQAATATLSDAQIQATNIIATATAGPLIATLTAEALQNPPQPTFTETAPLVPTSPFATATPPLAVVTTAPGSPTSGVDCVHQVVAGENLFRLSLRYGVPVNDIARASGVTNINLIVVDDRLTIPGCGTTGITPPPTTAPTAGAPGDPAPGGGTGGGRVHVVQQYQTLFEISLLYGVPVNTIAAANGISNINLIYINQELVIP